MKQEKAGESILSVNENQVSLRSDLETKSVFIKHKCRRCPLIDQTTRRDSRTRKMVVLVALELQVVYGDVRVVRCCTTAILWIFLSIVLIFCTNIVLNE
jgi:hypothetical protein